MLEEEVRSASKILSGELTSRKPSGQEGKNSRMHMKVQGRLMQARFI